MSVEVVVGLIASFLGGALLAAVSFMFAFVSRLTKLETTVSNLCDRVGKIPNIVIPCEFHSLLDKQVALSNASIDELKNEIRELKDSLR